MNKTSAQYSPNETEEKWYKYWLDNELFKSTPDEREPYTIVIPPPNVTGVLHMGHIMNNTIQDILIRRARLQGKNACWVPGTDHASIATEAKVVKKLADEGIDKNTLSREEFMKHAWEWTHKHGGIILQQLKKMGASCDWDRTKFTLDPEMYKSVIKVFVDLHKKGLIYRGVRMVNWDPKAKTAVSDEEVTHKEEKSKLYYIAYKIKDSDESITIATTRPETILGDTAICVHPEDERFTHLHGKTVIIPLAGREIPIILDTYVDREFGTGALKITPAHDENDYKIGQTHNLASINIFEDDGTMSKAAGLFIGKDRFEVRELISEQLKAENFLTKVENYMNKVGYSQRTDVVIEPKLSMQWFLKMEDLAKPAIENVENNVIRFVPERFKNTYRHWMENVRDWNISRQLWWGQQIPAYYIGDNTNDFVVAESDEEALILAKEKTGNQDLTMADLHQDPDVLDTWFSSWLWPISVFNGINEPENEEIKYYYPTNVLATGHDIIFFWVARMIVSGYEYRDELPFKDVYFTGMVRDDQGRKMSKQLGNSPDPLNLIDTYGADAVRVGMMLCSPAGGDLLYDNNLPEQGRNFSNKVWNAWRLVENWETDADAAQPEYAKVAVVWLKQKISETLGRLDKQYSDYRLSEALMTVYRLFKDEFSSWFLEAVKPPYQTPIDGKTYSEVLEIFEDLLKLLHPFMPFITEDIWHKIATRESGESIMSQAEPKAEAFDTDLLAKFEQAKEVISQLRNIRKQKNMPAKVKLELYYSASEGDYDTTFESVVAKLGGTEFINATETKIDGATQFIVKNTEYFVPLGDLVNKEEEIAKLEKDLKYTKGFLISVQKKLSNERFVNNAPPKVIEIERTKQSDAESKIKSIEEMLVSLKG